MTAPPPPPSAPPAVSDPVPPATLPTAPSPATAPISVATATHYRWGSGCDGWHLVRSPGLSVIEERMPPDTAETRHRHEAARQFFYVLEGGLDIEVDGRAHLVAAGSGLEVPPGAAHQVVNRGPAPARFLVVSQPPSHGDRVGA